MRRGPIVAGLVAALLLALAPAAAAKSYFIDTARVEVAVAPDGSLLVTEHLTFAFDGDFQGAYRDIPVRSGEAVFDVRVSEGGVAYAPGAPTALGSSGSPGTYGVEDQGSRVRVVWHYRQSGGERTFTVTYRMTGLTVAYDDVAEVNLQVWGDEWDVSLNALEAEMAIPGSPAPGDVRVWGHPASVQGFTEFAADGVTPTLYAVYVPPAQFVEMRVVFPRALLTSDRKSVV